MKVNLKKIILFAVACTLYSANKVNAHVPYADIATNILSIAADVVNIVTLDSTDVEKQKIAASLSTVARALNAVYNYHKVQDVDGKVIWSNMTPPFGDRFDITLSESHASLGLEGLSACLGDIPTFNKLKQLALYNKNVDRQQRLAAVKWSQGAWLLFNILLKMSAYYQKHTWTKENLILKDSKTKFIFGLRILAFWSEVARRYSFYKAKFNRLDEWKEENVQE